MNWPRIMPILLSGMAVAISIAALVYSCKADGRSEKLLQAQKISQIQVTPISFESYMHENEKMGRLTLSITNYAGFKALNVRDDANWEGVWIKPLIPVAEGGIKAQMKRRDLSEKELSELNSYERVRHHAGIDLDPGRSIKKTYQGYFSFDKRKRKAITVFVRWVNENGAQMEKFYYYELIINQVLGAESFSIIPWDDKKQL